jgi:hypothetical protein
MGQPIQPNDLQFTTREYFLDGAPDSANNSTLSFQQLDTTLIFLSYSISNAGNSFIGLTNATVPPNSNVITFTRSDTTTFPITVDTGSGQTYTAGNGISINGSNVVSARLGEGLTFNGALIDADVRTVNGVKPIGGNITTALTAVLTGPSASGTNNLIASSSGNKTGSLTNGTVWVVSGDSGTPDPDGLAYIFVSQSATAGGAGEWFPLSTLNQDQADLRYVRLNAGANNNQSITSSLIISGSSTTFSSSLYLLSGSKGIVNANGGIANVLVLSSSGQLFITGAYGVGGGSVAPANLSFSTQTIDYKLLQSDNNKVVRLFSSTNINAYVTASLFNEGDQVIVFQSGSGQITFIPDVTTTLLSANNMTKTRTQYSAATLTFSGSVCYLFGDIAP